MFLQVDYNSETDVKDDYTSRRTSKVTYRSEAALPNPLERWSRRIETATKLGTVNNRWCSILNKKKHFKWIKKARKLFIKV